MYVFAGDSTIQKYCKFVALPFNAFLFTFSVALDVLHGFGLWDAKTFGLGDFEHGVERAPHYQMVVNFACYAVLFFGEVPLIMRFLFGMLQDKMKMDRTGAGGNEQTKLVEGSHNAVDKEHDNGSSYGYGAINEA